MRDDVRLTSEEWEKLDELVVGAARKMLVGRRVVKIAGAFGVGLQTIPLDTWEVGKACRHEPECECGCDCSPVELSQRETLPLVVIHKDFWVPWRDIETSRQFNMPLDLSPAAAPAARTRWCWAALSRLQAVLWRPRIGTKRAAASQT